MTSGFEVHAPANREVQIYSGDDRIALYSEVIRVLRPSLRGHEVLSGAVWSGPKIHFDRNRVYQQYNDSVGSDQGSLVEDSHQRNPHVVELRAHQS